MVNGVDSLISFSDFSLLVYRNASDFRVLILYPAAAAKLFQSCPTLCDPHGLQPTRFLHPWDFPGKSTGMGCHCLLLYKIYGTL